MPWLLLIGMFLMGALATTWGGLALFSPRRWRSLVDTLSLADKWSEPDPTLSKADSIEMRVAGFIIAVVGLLFMWNAVSLSVQVLRGTSKPVDVPAAVEQKLDPQPKSSSFPIVVSLGAIAIGSFLLLHPGFYLSWSLREGSRRVPKERALPYLKLIVRVTGAAFVFAGASSLIDIFRLS